ncbi:unnamed protein product [Paramecium sonneborni]|uniref:Uncharacterized protein n=1 Tax=Paramecium sonneborni TaxID=65129 RepID=A0A8S1PWW8_9CILI|nr:unnamed protein product [Paramecium sonneborni]
MVYDDNAPISAKEKSKANTNQINKVETQEQKGNYSIPYRVTWIDNLHRKIIVTIRVTSDITVREFLQMVIGEFNQTFKRAEMELFFFLNDFNVYELYEMDEYERPDEELPPYDEHQKLRQLKTKSFALKQTQIMLNSLMVSSVSDPLSCKSPISPRSEEEKINPQNNNIQNTENIDEKLDCQEHESLKKSKETDQKPWWFLCCYDE